MPKEKNSHRLLVVPPPEIEYITQVILLALKCQWYLSNKGFGREFLNEFIEKEIDFLSLCFSRFVL